MSETKLNKTRKIVNEELMNYYSLKLFIVFYLFSIFIGLFHIWKESKTIQYIVLEVLLLIALGIILLFAFLYIEMFIRNKGKSIKIIKEVNVDTGFEINNVKEKDKADNLIHVNFNKENLNEED